MDTKAHAARVRQELTEAGVSKYGLIKSEARYLHKIIHPNEHVRAVVFGQHNSSSAMLAATEERLIYLDKKPMVLISDDFDYQAVNGVEFDIHTLFATLSLQTAVGNYVIRYANIKCAEKFKEYVDQKKLELDQPSTLKKQASELKKYATERWLKFLKNNNLGVLSSVGRTGDVRGTTVHYVLKSGQIYILSKAGTKKIHNILIHSQVCLTVFNQEQMKTLQLFGNAEIVPESDETREMIAEMLKPRIYGTELLPPPITKLDASDYVLMKITPYAHDYLDYKN